MRILVTNDDGIDSVGLHVLARALLPYGEVTIVAPDSEYSGAGAALGALHLIRPEVHTTTVPGIDRSFAVTGTPALCVLFARLGVFGPLPDLVVAGINPGANVGRAVYHSGTIGATLTARSGGISGVAVSQDVADLGVEGQGWDDVLLGQHWDTAAHVAATAVGGILADLPKEAVVLNLNVPNLPLAELKGWRQAEVGTVPPRALSTARLEPKEGHSGSFRVIMEYGQPAALPIELDGGAVTNGYVAMSWLSRLRHEPKAPGSTETALVRLLGPDGAGVRS